MEYIGQNRVPRLSGQWKFWPWQFEKPFDATIVILGKTRDKRPSLDIFDSVVKQNELEVEHDCTCLRNRTSSRSASVSWARSCSVSKVFVVNWWCVWWDWCSKRLHKARTSANSRQLSSFSHCKRRTRPSDSETVWLSNAHCEKMYIR